MAKEVGGVLGTLTLRCHTGMDEQADVVYDAETSHPYFPTAGKKVALQRNIENMSEAHLSSFRSFGSYRDTCVCLNGVWCIQEKRIDPWKSEAPR